MDAIRHHRQPAISRRGSPSPPNDPPRSAVRCPLPWSRSTVAPLLVLVILLGAAALVTAACGSQSGSVDGGISPTSSSSSNPRIAPTPDATLALVSGKMSDTLTVLDSYGQSATLVAGDGSELSDVRWSPDGARVAYLSSGSATDLANALMVYEVATAASAAVSFGDAAPAMVRDYAWISPTEIVAATYETALSSLKANGALYRCDVAAGTAQPLTDSSGEELRGMNLSASADGGRLAYTTLSGGGSGGMATETLELLDLAAGTVKHVARAKTDMATEGMSFDSALISPDGEHIYTNQMSVGPGFVVRIYGADGKAEARLSGLSWPGSAAWDPAGSGRVAFGSTVPEGDEFSGPAPPEKPVEIRIWDPRKGGTGEFVVIHAQKEGPLADFAWSPDGSWIAYTVVDWRHDPPTDDLYLLKSGGDRALLVMRDAGCPSWAIALVPQLYGGGSSTPETGPSE